MGATPFQHAAPVDDAGTVSVDFVADDDKWQARVVLDAAFLVEVHEFFLPFLEVVETVVVVDREGKEAKV